MFALPLAGIALRDPRRKVALLAASGPVLGLALFCAYLVFLRRDVAGG